MQALANAGDRAAALEHARIYDRGLRQKLGSPPDEVVKSLAGALRTKPAAMLATRVDATIGVPTGSDDGPLRLTSELEAYAGQDSMAADNTR